MTKQINLANRAIRRRKRQREKERRQRLKEGCGRLDEAGDVLWYLAELAAGLGVTLEDVARHNVDKLKRRYPNGFEAERSINRQCSNGECVYNAAYEGETCPASDGCGGFKEGET